MCPSVDEDGVELSLEILLVTELINDPGLKREKNLYELEGFRPSSGGSHFPGTFKTHSQ